MLWVDGWGTAHAGWAGKAAKRRLWLLLGGTVCLIRGQRKVLMTHGSCGALDSGGCSTPAPGGEVAFWRGSGTRRRGAALRCSPAGDLAFALGCRLAAFQRHERGDVVLVGEDEVVPPAAAAVAAAGAAAGGAAAVGSSGRRQCCGPHATNVVVLMRPSQTQKASKIDEGNECKRRGNAALVGRGGGGRPAAAQRGQQPACQQPAAAIRALVRVQDQHRAWPAHATAADRGRAIGAVSAPTTTINFQKKTWLIRNLPPSARHAPHLRSTAERSLAGLDRHCGSTACAAAMALRVSSARMRGMVAMTLPVAGFFTCVHTP